MPLLLLRSRIRFSWVICILKALKFPCLVHRKTFERLVEERFSVALISLRVSPRGIYTSFVLLRFSYLFYEASDCTKSSNDLESFSVTVLADDGIKVSSSF